MPKAKFKVLSIDGGGIRGVVPCTLLKFIESQVGVLSSTFDLMAGTSTGGIISLGLATGKEDSDQPFSADDMLRLYRMNGEQIFEKRREDFVSRLGSVISSAFDIGMAKELTNNPYIEANIENLLKQYFSETRLADTLTNVLVTTYDIKEGKPFFFSTRYAKKIAEENFFIRDIARSTSAAPTYFEPAIIHDNGVQEKVFVDGGVFANNPSILAYGEAKEIWKARATLAFEPVVAPTDDDLPFYMLSIGTGSCRSSISGDDAQNWRTAQWLNPMLTSVFMQSVAESTHYTMQHLLPPYKDGTLRYQRLNMDIPVENSQMDNASKENIDQLCEIAEDYVRKNESELLRICEHLI